MLSKGVLARAKTIPFIKTLHHNHLTHKEKIADYRLSGAILYDSGLHVKQFRSMVLDSVWFCGKVIAELS
jgi:hypothetical protein